MEKGTSKNLILLGSSLELMWDDFCSRYDFIKAAGGIVRNSKNEILWIRRNEKWDLPKGKVEFGERIEETAVREVEEECAVTSIEIGELLGTTYHTYSYKGINILKKSYWFAMSCLGKQNLTPQEEEGITEVVWANTAAQKLYALDTYKSIAELLKQEKVLLYLDV
jgi:ADP-ribose pyrophosphatase YjhB (NUDIX family)